MKIENFQLKHDNIPESIHKTSTSNNPIFLSKNMDEFPLSKSNFKINESNLGTRNMNKQALFIPKDKADKFINSKPKRDLLERHRRIAQMYSDGK
ncbi:hypothetical protein LNN31_16740 [Acetobacterium wieringae]|uniref:Uncharacterized protein n=1 Tax=Acetobacterium wieringae TaxID=52694 RepID=A0ABY6HD48_9FIRM|nr:hypothetical protein [Acetobacterium wieringae]MEA4805749.1 hypothetical protein [Acetobacterium wieringae]UYO62414.1 hypothetical protein LNN31_16740 [Acetobacterium wieringae]VUZ26538.1 Uncharacterised protein [Acetobacterium wieringae]